VVASVVLRLGPVCAPAQARARLTASAAPACLPVPAPTACPRDYFGTCPPVWLCLLARACARLPARPGTCPPA